MPSKSAKQARLMAAACHGKTRNKISKKVACEFNRSDRGTGILRGKRRK
jgi:hypothetical protein